jgi:hypothetical protein
LTRFEAWTVHLATLLVGGTGLVYAWMLYLLSPVDELSVVNHPWQPDVQHLHVLAAPLLVFAAGLIWRRHVWNCWRLGVKDRHRSGVALALTLAPMTVSGYLLQTSVGETWRQVWLAVHLITSGLWILGYVVHQAIPWAQRAFQRGRSGSPLDVSASADPTSGTRSARAPLRRSPRPTARPAGAAGLPGAAAPRAGR